MRSAKLVKPAFRKLGRRNKTTAGKILFLALAILGISLPVTVTRADPNQQPELDRIELPNRALSNLDPLSLGKFGGRAETNVYFVPLGDASNHRLTSPTTDEVLDDDLDRRRGDPRSCWEPKEQIRFFHHNAGQPVYSVSKQSLQIMSEGSGARCGSYRAFSQDSQSSSASKASPPKGQSPPGSPEVCRLSLTDRMLESMVEDHNAILVTTEVVENYAASLYSRSRAFRLAGYFDEDPYFERGSGGIPLSRWTRVLKQRITGLPLLQDSYITEQQFNRINRQRIDESLGDGTQSQVLIDATVHACLIDEDLGPLAVRAISTNCHVGTPDIFHAVRHATSCRTYAESRIATDKELLSRIRELQDSWLGSLSWVPWSNADQIEQHVTWLGDRYDHLLRAYWDVLNDALNSNVPAPDSFRPLVSAFFQTHSDSETVAETNFVETMVSSTALYYGLLSGRLGDGIAQDMWSISAGSSDVWLCLEQASGGAPAYFDQDSYAAILKKAEEVGLVPISSLAHVSTLAVLEVSQYAADSCILNT